MQKKELSEAERWRILGFLDACPDCKLCAEIYGHSISTIYNIKNKYESSLNLKDSPRSGRPPLSNEITEKIVEEIKQKGTSSREIAGKLEISHYSVQKYAHLSNLQFRRFEEIPKLTEDHKKRRVEFCEKYRDEDFHNWFFVDESYFHLFRNTMGQWTSESHIYIERTNPNVAYMIWAGISKKGKTPICIEEYGYKINQDEYKKILKKNLIPYGNVFYGGKNWTLLQDNARPHIGKEIVNWMTKKIPKIVNMPPYSPELNPIEHIWALMKKEVEKKQPKNSADLKSAIMESWNGLSQEIIDNCINHIKEEMIKIIKNKGEFSND